MKFHGERAIEFLGFERYNPEKDKKEPAMFWLYSLDDYKTLAKHFGQRYIFWHGVDVMYLRQFKEKLLPIIRFTNTICACHNERQQNLLAEMGIYAYVRPVFWNDINKYERSNGKHTKEVYFTSHPGREFDYGEPMINAVAAFLKDWKFHIFGTHKTLPVCDNVIYHGQIPEDDMDQLTRNFAATIRWHNLNGYHYDGVSQTVIKALLRGHMAITGLKYPFTYHAENIEEIISYLENIDQLKGSLPKIDLNNFDWLELN